MPNTMYELTEEGGGSEEVGKDIPEDQCFKLCKAKRDENPNVNGIHITWNKKCRCVSKMSGKRYDRYGASICYFTGKSSIY